MIIFNIAIYKMSRDDSRMVSAQRKSDRKARSSICSHNPGHHSDQQPHPARVSAHKRIHDNLKPLLDDGCAMFTIHE